MTLGKKFENLTIYNIGPMEGDDEADNEFSKVENAFMEAGIKPENYNNPCKQEQAKTGFDVCDSNKHIKKLRMMGKDEETNHIYEAIWRVDMENVRKADILVANIPPGTAYVGTAREATYASMILGLDLIEDNFKDITMPCPHCQKELQVYKECVRPGLKKIGFPIKRVYLITSAKTRINGTMVHGMVLPSGGKVFKNVKELIAELQEVYK